MDRKEIIEKITPHRTMPLFGTIDGDLYCYARDHLTKMVCQSQSEPLTILIDSTGGDSFYGYQIGDIIGMLPVEVIGVAMEAKSAAFVILQRCAQRLIVPSGRLLIHSTQPTLGPVGTIMRLDERWQDKIEQIIKLTEKYRQQQIDLICSRSNLPPEKVIEITKQGDDPYFPYHIYAEEALKLNLVDGIVPADYKLFVPPALKKPDKPSEEKVPDIIKA